jgi:nucleoside-diphosphate-sugar epimerase
MFFGALESGHYECYLEPDTFVPVIHMDDCVEATLQLIGAERSNLKRCVYNLAGNSMSPRIMVEEVQKLIPGT